MQGLYLIERETSWGDRAWVGSIDIEGQLSGTDPLKIAMEQADEALAEGGVYRVAIVHDDGWSRPLVHASRIAGRKWMRRNPKARFATKRER